ncbi:hypothetical protein LOZ80_26065 [Paenibacillus sp. HWE-109]|uniref:hypothetical protein n=1 Tax=Paenibacillus sp. HWE-109 TaxID=1306526 RepID=UPI001EDEAF09|nr:hypothetical protein [Paenibacillus sp. HWE-109]UKS25047.1 hypothetical protein LOZ80_26065 [Paenibacillus sp. HWE-109]
MKHIVMYSGGSGSKQAAKRVAKENGITELFLLFTDTLVEDRDTYRYMIESALHLYGVPADSELLMMVEAIPDIKSEEDIEERKRIMPLIAKATMVQAPNFIWLIDGRTPWDVFKDNRWIGNSRVAQCSHELKQALSGRYIRDNYKPDEVILYVGIDWSEDHRMKGIIKHWAPYTVVAPLTEEPYVTKHEIHLEDQQNGTRVQRMYRKGYAHANCGGFCVRAGKGHFINFLKDNPDYYKYNEKKEKDMQAYLDRSDVTVQFNSIFSHYEINDEGKKLAKYKKIPYSLEQLRDDWENGLGLQIDLEDIGGCGCFASYE